MQEGGEIVALAICADTAHPEHAAAAADRGATIYAAGSLITPAGYEEDACRLKSYARRHSMAAMLANHAGPSGGLMGAGRSAIWRAGGELLVEGPPEAEVLVVGIRAKSGWTGTVRQVR